MRFESCLAVFLTSLVVITVGSNDDDDNISANFYEEILPLKHRDDQKNSSDDATQQRSKRSLSYNERDSVLRNFNYQRSLVGASDMNYVDYSTALEDDLSDWTRRCNYDGDFYSDYDGYVLRAAVRGYPDHATEIQKIFSDSKTSVFYDVRSIYVTGVAGSFQYCSSLIVNGAIYYGVYLNAYGVLTDGRRFIETVQQYTLGPACSRCQSNVAWCYNNLCRDVCDMSIYGCCQISNGIKTEVCATTTTTTTTTTPRLNYYSGAAGIEAIGTAMLYGLLLLVLCHHFQ